MGQGRTSALRLAGMLSCLVLFLCLLIALTPKDVSAETVNSELGFSTETKTGIRDIGVDIKNRNLVANPITTLDLDRVGALPEAARLATLRRMASAVILERREASGIDILSVYKSEARSLKSKRDIEIAALYERYLQVRALGPNHVKSASFMNDIVAAKSGEDWFVAHRAHVLNALLQARQRKYNDALNSLNEAAKLQPREISDTTREASYEQSNILAFVYTVTGNATATLDAIQDLIGQGNELGEPIDGVTHFNNLIYLSSKWREFDLSTELSRMMLSMPGLANQDKAIGYMRLAQSLNRSGYFEDAASAAQTGLSLGPADNWKINLQVEEAISFAGMGDVEQARAAMAEIKIASQDNPRFEQMFQKSFLLIDALTAMSSDEADQVYDILMDYNQVDMQRQLKSNERSNNNYLQALQKSEAITREREATQRAQLEAITLERDNRTKQLTFAVIITILLALISIGGLFLARFYKKTSIENAHLRDLAMAGERSKSEFLAVMSHELRTPLNGIIGLSDVLSREARDEDIKFKSSVIMRSGLSLLDLLTNILDMSKMERGQMTINPVPMSVHELINGLRELWLPTAKAKGLILTMHVDEDLPDYIMLDLMRLRQCCENLVSNAIKFTKTGRVHVHVTAAAPDKAGNFILTLIVADTGRGMSQDQIETVFKPFTQADTTISREYGGSGLGMAITRSLARMMDGDVTVVSREGRGSEFTLTVKTQAAHAPKAEKTATLTSSQNHKPHAISVEHKTQSLTERAQRLEKIDAAILAANAAANVEAMPHARYVPTQAETSVPATSKAVDSTPAIPKSKAHSSDPFRGLRILVAEDISSNQDILGVFLNPVGAVVTFAANGREAIEAIEREDFDVVLMDIRMPVMDGIEATTIIRAMSPEKSGLPIIALTADASAENNAKCMAAGANVFLTKPVVAAELFGSIRFVLKQGEQQSRRA